MPASEVEGAVFPLLFDRSLNFAFLSLNRKLLYRLHAKISRFPLEHQGLYRSKLEKENTTPASHTK
jgi:hypothetical protein